MNFKKILLVTGLFLILVLGIFAIKTMLATEKITYHGRTYILASYGTLPQMHLQNIKNSKATGELVNGLKVYGEENIHTPTILYLKRKDGRFLVYALSGGP